MLKELRRHFYNCNNNIQRKDGPPGIDEKKKKSKSQIDH